MNTGIRVSAGGMRAFASVLLGTLVGVSVLTSCSRGSRAPSLTGGASSASIEEILTPEKASEIPLPALSGEKFVLSVVNEGTTQSAKAPEDFTLEITEDSAESVVAVSLTRDTALPAYLLELAYDAAMFTPIEVQPGTAITPDTSLFLAVTSQVGRVYLGIARIGDEDTPSPVLPAGSALATAKFIRQPFSLKGASSNGTRRVAAKAFRLLAQTKPQGIVLTWRGEHPGDYDLNGVVSISDLTPLAAYFGAEPMIGADGLPVSSGDNEYIANIDSNDDGIVGISDITAIAANFGSVVAGYRVYRGTSDGEGSPIWDDAIQPNAEDPTAPFTVPFNSSRQAGEFQRYSYSLSAESAGESSSVHLKVSATDGVIDGESVEIEVFREVPHEPFACTVCHNEADMTFKGVDATCLLCHPQPLEDTEREWTDGPPLHSACLNCHQAHEFRIVPPEQVCANCHSTLATEVAGTGMEACLGCHEAPHLPTAQPVQNTCNTCHASTVEKVAASSMNDCFLCHQPHQWEATEEGCTVCHSHEVAEVAGSPMPLCSSCHGDHNFASVSALDSCQSCHAEEQAKVADTAMPTCDTCHQAHQWQAEPSACQDCHATVASEVSRGWMPECAWCHTDHAFDAASARSQCKECHTKPPEDAAASWGDAPTQHVHCYSCHQAHTFGLTESEIDTLCGTCHIEVVEPTQAAGMASCASCHQSPHLPKRQLDVARCDDCHGDVSSRVAGSAKEDCFTCHEAHFWQADSSSCATCHDGVAQELTGSGMADCSLCHGNHNFDTGGLFDACENCHAKPLPGLHNKKKHKNASCNRCHSAHDFDLVTRATCLDCHHNRENHNPGVNCIECHDFAG